MNSGVIDYLKRHNLISQNWVNVKPHVLKVKELVREYGQLNKVAYIIYIMKIELTAAIPNPHITQLNVGQSLNSTNKYKTLNEYFNHLLVQVQPTFPGEEQSLDGEQSPINSPQKEEQQLNKKAKKSKEVPEDSKNKQSWRSFLQHNREDIIDLSTTNTHFVFDIRDENDNPVNTPYTIRKLVESQSDKYPDIILNNLIDRYVDCKYVITYKQRIQKGTKDKDNLKNYRIPTYYMLKNNDNSQFIFYNIEGNRFKYIFVSEGQIVLDKRSLDDKWIRQFLQLLKDKQLPQNEKESRSFVVLSRINQQQTALDKKGTFKQTVRVIQSGDNLVINQILGRLDIALAHTNT